MSQALQAQSLAMSDTLVWHPSVFEPPEGQSLSESLPTSLARAVAQWPDLPAVVFDEQSWSYADLARRAAGLALEIDDAVDVPGPVALVQSVGFDAIAAWFACALAGRPFLLLEPDHPPARLLELINAAACSLVLCDHATSQAFANQPHLNLLISDGRLDTLRPEQGLAASQAAMIFPTSGSTGTPKLVTYSATTLQVKAQSSRRLMQVSESARVLIAGSHGNYGFLHHACVFLLSGGTLCLADVKAGGFGAVLHAIDRLGARHARFTPSMFRKLAHIWDSVLWPGAHAHDADFLSLGGDSLKLMALSLEVERVFGRSMPLEDFLANSTLQHLAALLGIEKRAPAAPRRQGLQVRQVWPGLQPVKGIALAMPGWGGKAMAVPFGRSDLFPGHDLWAADYDFGDGTMRDEQRWWQAAQAIVEHIRSGAIPPPRVIFGYSFAGGLAWLVSRLLVGTPQCPQFVVIVDSAPLHRLPSFRPGQAMRALARVSHMQAPATLHIRRAPLSGWEAAEGNTRLWQDADQIHMRIDLPTIDHGEMAQRDMLVLASDGVRAFMNGQYSDLTVRQHLPDMTGVRLHLMLSGQHIPTPHALNDLHEHIKNHFNTNHFMALLHLTGLHGMQHSCRDLIDTAIQRIPQSRLIQYAYRRHQREARMLCPQDIPAFLPTTLAAVDQSLIRFQPHTVRPSPKPLRMLCLAYDICRATLTALHHRSLRKSQG